MIQLQSVPMKNTMRTVRRGALLPLLSALALAAGCRDVVDPPAAAPWDLEPSAPGIHPLLVVTHSGGTSSVELHFRRVEEPRRIGAFQGALEYDGAGVALTSASMPEGVTGAWHESGPGTIRFSGISTQGIDSSAVLVLTFRAAAPIEASMFKLAIEELVSPDFADLRPILRLGGTRARLTRAVR